MSKWPFCRFGVNNALKALSSPNSVKCKSSISRGSVFDIYAHYLSKQKTIRNISHSPFIIIGVLLISINLSNGGTIPIPAKVNSMLTMNRTEPEDTKGSGTFLSNVNIVRENSFPFKESSSDLESQLYDESNIKGLGGNRKQRMRLDKDKEKLRLELLKQIKSLDHMKCFPKVLCGLSVDSSKTSSDLDSYLVRSYIQLMRSANPDDDSSEETKPSTDRSKDALSLFLMKSGILKEKNQKKRTSQSASSSEEGSVEEHAELLEPQTEVFKSSIEKKNEALQRLLLTKRKLDMTGDNWNFSNKTDLYNMKDTKSDFYSFLPVVHVSTGPNLKESQDESSSITSQIGSLVSSWAPRVSFSFGTDSFEKDPFFKGGGSTAVVKHTSNFNENKWQKDLDKLAILMKLREAEIMMKKKRKQPRISEDNLDDEEDDMTNINRRNDATQEMFRRSRNMAASIVDDEMQVYSTAVEIGKKLKHSKQCDFLFNGCPVPYSDIIKIISTIRKDIQQSDETIEALSKEIFEYAQLSSKSKKPNPRSPAKVKTKPPKAETTQTGTVKKQLQKQPMTQISMIRPNGEKVQINVQLSGKDDVFDIDGGGGDDGELEVESVYEDESPPEDDVPEEEAPMFDTEKVKDEDAATISAEYELDDEKMDADFRKPLPIDIFNKIIKGSTSTTTTTEKPSPSTTTTRKATTTTTKKATTTTTKKATTTTTKATTTTAKPTTTKYTISKNPKQKARPRPTTPNTTRKPNPSKKPSTNRPTRRPSTTTVKVKRTTRQPTVMPRSTKPTTSIPEYSNYKKTSTKTTTRYTTKKPLVSTSVITTTTKRSATIPTKKTIEYDRKATGGTLKTTPRPKHSIKGAPLVTTQRSSTTSTTAMLHPTNLGNSETITDEVKRKRKPTITSNGEKTISNVLIEKNSGKISNHGTKTSSSTHSNNKKGEKRPEIGLVQAVRISTTKATTTTTSKPKPSTTTTLPPLAMFTKSYMDEIIAEMYKTTEIPLGKPTNSKYSVVKKRKPPSLSLESPSFETSYLSVESGSGEITMFQKMKGEGGESNTKSSLEIKKLSKHPTSITQVPMLFSAEGSSTNTDDSDSLVLHGENTGNGKRKIKYKNPKRPYVVLYNYSPKDSLEHFNSKRASPKPKRKRPNPTIIESEERDTTTSGNSTFTLISNTVGNIMTDSDDDRKYSKTNATIITESKSEEVTSKLRKPDLAKPQVMDPTLSEGEYPYWIPSLV